MTYTISLLFWMCMWFLSLLNLIDGHSNFKMIEFQLCALFVLVSYALMRIEDLGLITKINDVEKPKETK